MPKKSTAARSGAQRQKPRAQKSFEVVRQNSERQEVETEEVTESAETNVSTATIPTPEKSAREPQPAESANATRTAPKGSAAARIAARRQAVQKAQQRSAASLISPEHFTYVRRDLIIIATLAVIMFTAIVVSYFLLGRGA